MFERYKKHLVFLIIAFVIVGISTLVVLLVSHDVKFLKKLKEEVNIPEKNATLTRPMAEEELKKEAQQQVVKIYKIDTDDGFVKGEERKYKYGTNGETYYAFQGIPYASPPIGLLRFKDPEPVTPWEDVLDASKEKNVCPQKLIPGRAPSEVIGSENCLFLNVYTPNRPDKIDNLLPVMVWFHGGGFQTGSGNTDFYGPDFLIKHDIILVTFNYRLGALGFLNLEVAGAPGNAGLKDQLMVLRWIKSNISQFAGDPNNITAFGEDAGAASIQMLSLLKTVKKEELFHKIILQSGSVMNPWAFTDDNEEDALELAKQLMIPTLSKGYDKIIEELQSKSIKDIVNAQDSIVTDKDLESLKLYCFVPSVETVNDTEISIITSNPYLAFASGHLEDFPTMAGINNGEANIAFLYYPELITSQFMESLNKVPDVFIPSILRVFDDDLIKNIAKTVVKKFYFHDDHISWKHIPELFELLSDGLISIGMYMTIEIMKYTPSPFYVYEFSFEGDLNYAGNKAKQVFNIKNYQEKTNAEVNEPSKNYPDNKIVRNVKFDQDHDIDYDKIKISGAAHMDELGYLFLVSKFDKEIPNNKKEYQIREQLTLMWTNFAKNTNPNSPEIPVEWPECRDKNVSYLKIGNALEPINEDIEKLRNLFWKNLFIAIFQGNPTIIMNYLQENHLI